MKKSILLLLFLFSINSICHADVDFDGVDDLMTISSDPSVSGSKFSIFSIFRIDALPVTGDAFIHTLYTNDGSGSVDGIELRIGLDGTDANKDKMHCHFATTDGSPARIQVNSTLVLTTNVWYSTFCWSSGNFINIKVCNLENRECTETTGDAVGSETIKTPSGTDFANRSGGRFWEGPIAILAVWNNQVIRSPFEDSLEKGYLKRLPCQSQPEDLSFYTALDACPHGNSCDGQVFYSPCASTITATGSDGANNTGLVGAGSRVLNY